MRHTVLARLCSLILCLLLLLTLPLAVSATQTGGLTLTESEAALVAASKEKPFTVGIIPSYAPSCFFDEQADSFSGILIELLNTVSIKTGLQFEYVWLDMQRGSPPEQVKNGTPQLVAGVLKTAGNAGDTQLVLSDDLTSETLVMVGRRGDNFTRDAADKTIALMRSFPMAEQYLSVQFPTHTVVKYDTQEQCLDAVRDGSADATPYLRNCMNYYLQNPHYRSLEIIDAYAQNVAIGLAGSAADEGPLVALINKGLALIPDSERNRIMMDYTTMHPYQLSIGDILYQYHTPLVLAVLLLLAIICIVVVLLRRASLAKAALAAEQLTDVINTVPCGISLQRWDGVKLTPIVVNEQFTQMLGENALTYMQDVKNMQYPHVHPDDRERLHEETMRALTETKEIDTTYRLLNYTTNKYLWVRMRGRVLPQPDGSQLAYVSYYDVTQEHMAKHLADTALGNSGVSLCEFDFARRCIIQHQNSVQMHGFDTVISDVPQSLTSSGYVHPDDADALCKMYEQLLSGAPFAEGVFRVKTADRNGWWYEHIRYTTEFDESGTPIRAAGVSSDETEKQEALARYAREMELKKAAITKDDLIAYALYDLTTQQTLECRYRDGEDVPEDDRTDFMYTQVTPDKLIDETERAAFIELNNMQTLLARFDAGETEFKLEYRRRLPDGSIIWVRNFLRLLRDPNCGDVLLFQYWYNIDSKKTQELMYRSIVTDSYDFIARIDGNTHRYEVLTQKGLCCHIPPERGEDADEMASSPYLDCVPEEERQSIHESSLLKTVKQRLRETDRYVFSYRMKTPDGTLRNKRVSYYYLDEPRALIVMMREDVTDLLREEAEKNRQLAVALDAANQASVAKSQFLSRVSHELRTPLNAIIGYNTLARGEMMPEGRTEPNPAADKALDCLVKSDIASKHLLTIINDVLDMSAIESGKIRIANERFNFKELVSSMTAVFYPQATTKHIVFDVVLDQVSDEWFVGDALRINQILNNLVSNAIKFTPPEGSILIRINQTEQDRTHSRMRFCVTDTGIGMDSKYLSHIWTPFEQADSSISRLFGGTGLGLSITKNLVDLMNGQISVQSAPGKGSTFVVELPLQRTEQHRPNSGSDFSKVHALVVDDDLGTCEYLRLLLNRFGVRCSAVSSGKDAITAYELAAKRNDPFTICLVDWRMPEMDGFETIRRIRTFAGLNLPIIVISAYDYSEIADKASTVGVNLFLAKPLFPSSVFDLLATTCSKSTNLRTDMAEQSAGVEKADFGGARVLLAEDNEMNMEIARRILEGAHLKVDGAWNGEDAVKCFLSAPAGTYQLILMDVQMPKMDGYEATRAIRSSEHAQAQSIPILAMTADAFAENVAAAKTAGMNDHIAKPISLHTLFDTLRKYLPAAQE